MTGFRARFQDAEGAKEEQTKKVVEMFSSRDRLDPDNAPMKKVSSLRSKLIKSAAKSKGATNILEARLAATKKATSWDDRGHKLDMADMERIHAELRRAMHRTKHICEELLMKHDRDHTGAMSKEELKRVFRAELRIPVQRLKDEEIDACLDVLDVDSSGKLTIDEIAQFMELGVAVFRSFEEDDAPMASASDFYERLDRKNKRKMGNHEDQRWDVSHEVEYSSKTITQNQVTNSMDLRKEAQILFDYAKGLKEKTVRKNMQIGYNVQAKLKSRIVHQEALSSELMECMARVEPATYLMQMSIQQLNKARSNLWPPLSIVKKRIKIRRDFNTAELERDYFQEAMVFEEQMLEEGRATLLQRIDTGKDILNGLEENRAEMLKVVELQRDELKDDRTALLVAQDKLMATHAMSQASSETKSLRGQWKNIAYTLMDTTKSLEDDAKEYRKENDRVIDMITDDAAKAKQHCKDSLERHMLEMERLMKQLEKEIFHSHHAVSGVEHTVSETRRQFEKTQAPLMHTLKKVEQVSNTNKARLTIMESVQSKHDKLEATAQGLEGQLEWADALLDKLNESHHSLIEDHHAKSRALKIDEHCLRVTPDKEEDLIVKRNLVRPKVSPEQLLLPSQIEQLRIKIRAAASTGFDRTMQLDKFFARLNSSGSEDMTYLEVKQALRIKLRISKEVLTDLQINALCSILDEDGSESVGVKELAEFISQEPDLPKFKAQQRKKSLSAREKRERAELQARPPLEELPYLRPSVLEQLRRKIKCVASSAQEPLEKIFARFDLDHSGELEDSEIKKALRYGLKIPKSLISDHEIFAWCHMLDGDNSGALDISEIVEWINMPESNAWIKPGKSKNADKTKAKG